ncbi:rRNA maturation RNase YbeY [Patescibacteria group bacterium]|nr:MAG: rRNA maturation RNase YbeY [Patescibacteria group bacterium]
MTIQLVGDWPTELATAVQAIAAAVDNDDQVELPDGMVNLLLVDDAQITELNTQYTGNAYATDVLTFPYQPVENDDPTIADVVISTETAARQAEQAQIEVVDEVGLLALHGLLHAAGYDHSTPEGQQQMEAIQQRVMVDSNLRYRDFKWNQ